MEAEGLGVRAALRIPLSIIVVLVFATFSAISYTNITADELSRAGNSVASEVNYLCLQLESLANRAEAFDRVTSVSGKLPEEIKSADAPDYQLLSDPVGDVLAGYTLAETGTVCIAADDIVVSSDDERLPAGSNLQTALGDSAYAAISESMASGAMQPIPLEGVLAGSALDQDGYLMARQQGEYTVVIVEPSSMVFRDRTSTLIREAAVAFIILVVMSILLDRLLVYLVARRIDKTNEALDRITKGDLDARVEETGTRELKSLARGINATVDALQGWIAEAESRMAAELATAKAIQEATLPRTFPAFPDIPRFDLYASMDAAREVGGDFYDFFLVGKNCTPEAGKVCFVVADVSGKGVPAALFMMKAKALIHDYVGSGMELGKAITEANRSICEGNEEDMFVTAWIGVLDYATGHLDYVNAGHNPPLMWQSDGGWRWLRNTSGLVLGLFGMEYKAFSVECEAGDAFLLYTDGVTEAFDVEGELYGEDRLLALMEKNGKPGAQETQRLVREDVAAHAEGAEQSDDITILALEVRA